MKISKLGLAVGVLALGISSVSAMDKVEYFFNDFKKLNRTDLTIHKNVNGNMCTLTDSNGKVQAGVKMDECDALEEAYNAFLDYAGRVHGEFCIYKTYGNTSNNTGPYMTTYCVDGQVFMETVTRQFIQVMDKSETNTLIPKTCGCD